MNDLHPMSSVPQTQMNNKHCLLQYKPLPNKGVVSQIGYPLCAQGEYLPQEQILLANSDQTSFQCCQAQYNPLWYRFYQFFVERDTLACLYSTLSESPQSRGLRCLSSPAYYSSLPKRFFRDAVSDSSIFSRRSWIASEGSGF